MSIYTYEELERYYEIELNELYEDVNVCGYTYDSGTLLKAIDPEAFERGLGEWIDANNYRTVRIEGEDIYEELDE
jgi:hypothetical protein